MNFFSRFKQNLLALLSKPDGSGINWTGLTVAILLLISIGMTVDVLHLQQEVRQRAGSCKVQKAECNINQSDNACCPGLQCVINNPRSGNGKCALMPTSIPPTSSPNPPSGEGGSSTPESGGTTPGLGGIGSSPAPVQCGPNGCGWSPRPEGENSTTNPPGVQVCTLSFNGPKQLIGTRLTSTSIRFNWWPTPGGADKQFIQYGLESGKPQWGLINIEGNQGQIVVDYLPANKMIWAQVRAYKGNCYEDTGWVSVKPSNQAAFATIIPQQTGVPTPAITVQPTSITIVDSSYNSDPTVTPETDQYSLFQGLSQSPNNVISLFFILLLMGLFYPLLKNRKRKK